MRIGYLDDSNFTKSTGSIYHKFNDDSNAKTNNKSKWPRSRNNFQILNILVKGTSTC